MSRMVVVTRQVTPVGTVTDATPSTPRSIHALALSPLAPRRPIEKLQPWSWPPAVVSSTVMVCAGSVPLTVTRNDGQVGRPLPRIHTSAY